MFEKVKQNAAPKRDKSLVLAILLAVAVLAAALPPVITALRGSYRYHDFVLAFSQSLVSARGGGAIEYTAEDGKTEPISADKVSRVFTELTAHGLGQSLRKDPDAQGVSVSLPDGTSLAFFNTPFEREDGTSLGVTVRYTAPDGEVFAYLQRDTDYALLVQLLEL